MSRRYRPFDPFERGGAFEGAREIRFPRPPRRFWIGAALGVLRAMVWITAPKPLVAVLALALAWFSYPFMPALNSVMGTTSVVFFLGGGVIYSLGAVTYALKKPDPWPAVFGYHEVFHTLVVIGAACHFVAVARVVLGMSG